ncbi:hypothetical protein MTP99_012178 [Tenebrio molitor]|nr:hypothetical protein MTP99_012178 [Tenebrio molitor]
MRGAPDIADAPAIPGLLDRQGRARHHCGLYRLTVSPQKQQSKPPENRKNWNAARCSAMHFAQFPPTQATSSARAKG